MGPHFFKCGKVTTAEVRTTVVVSFNGAALFQVRKAQHYPRRSQASYELQWGRTFSSAERQEGAQENHEEVTLQWGRTFSSAESTRLPTTGRRRDKASMGPHFFKCGKTNIVVAGHTYKPLELQWGRTFSSAERRRKSEMISSTASLQWGRTFSSAER